MNVDRQYEWRLEKICHGCPREEDKMIDAAQCYVLLVCENNCLSFKMCLLN